MSTTRENLPKIIVDIQGELPMSSLIELGSLFLTKVKLVVLANFLLFTDVEIFVIEIVVDSICAYCRHCEPTQQ